MDTVAKTVKNPRARNGARYTRGAGRAVQWAAWPYMRVRGTNSVPLEIAGSARRDAPLDALAGLFVALRDERSGAIPAAWATGHTVPGATGPVRAWGMAPRTVDANGWARLALDPEHIRATLAREAREADARREASLAGAVARREATKGRARHAARPVRPMPPVERR